MPGTAFLWVYRQWRAPFDWLKGRAAARPSTGSGHARAAAHAEQYYVHEPARSGRRLAIYVGTRAQGAI